MYKIKIAGTGSYLPDKILSNFDLEKIIDTNDQWIRERTGIERRHIATEGQATSDLAYQASLRAIEASQLKTEEIELIVFCTITGDQMMPSSACILQHKLGLTSVPAFDLAAACSGFVYGLTVASQFIKNGTYKTVLVVGAEVIHPFVNYKDRDTSILFGDGAGAFLLTRSSENEDCLFYNSYLRAEGSLSELFILPAGGSKIPMSHSVLDQELHYMKMKGREIFKNAVRTMSYSCQKVLEDNQKKIEDVDWLIPHQANRRIMEAVADHFSFPKEKVISVVHETGNTSAATIPLAFDIAVKDGRIQRGQTILLTAFGAGLTAGSLLLKY